jgi:hypothetical protein
MFWLLLCCFCFLVHFVEIDVAGDVYIVGFVNYKAVNKSKATYISYRCASRPLLSVVLASILIGALDGPSTYALHLCLYRRTLVLKIEFPARFHL